MIHLHFWLMTLGFLIPIIGQSATGIDPITQLLTLLLTTLSGVLPGSVQNQEKLQQQASQRQLSASDLAQNPNAMTARLASLLGMGGNPSAAGGGAGGISGILQSLISKFTPQTTQGLTNNAWQQIQPQLAASGLSQAPGIANEELTTALAPSIIQEQQLGAQEASTGLQEGLNTETTGLGFPFQIGSAGAGSFPSFAAL